MVIVTLDDVVGGLVEGFRKKGALRLGLFFLWPRFECLKTLLANFIDIEDLCTNCKMPSYITPPFPVTLTFTSVNIVS